MVSGHAWQQRPALVWGSLVRQTAVEDNMVQTTERCTNRRAAMRALMLEKDATGAFSASVKSLDAAALPPGDVLVAVEYSTLNYKDGLAITQKAPVVRSWPMVAGIDGAGLVLSSQHPGFKPGDRVVHNGWGLGETRWGCMSEQASLQGDWLVKLPDAISNRQAMAIGTAGYTAMLCVMALQSQGVNPGSGEVLVTGATGGVGSVAVALLAKAGYHVVAATGKVHEGQYLEALGAAQLIDRAELAAAGKPLQKERWAGVVDAVGSHTLVNALAQTRYGGAVAACGLAQGGDLPGSVMPFILRGVKLVGVDSVMAPLALRQQAWSRLASELPSALLERMVTEVDLNDAVQAAQRLMSGQVRGRVVVKVAA
jgi:acrylyl-CoA reductase (NADPH)